MIGNIVGSVYWRPVFNLLEGQCEVLVVNALVVNAYHVKAVPGRKTDVKDAEWLADLLRPIRHGLVRARFIPSPTQRHLRDLTRYRIHLVDSLTSERGSPIGCRPWQAVREDANSKLAAVVTDVRGLLSARDLAAPARRRDGETAKPTRGR